MAVHVDVVWHPVFNNVIGAGCQSTYVVPGPWIISHGFSSVFVLLALVPGSQYGSDSWEAQSKQKGSQYNWDCLGYCLDCASSNSPFALHRLPEGAVRAIITGNAATEAAGSEWARKLFFGQLLYFESGLGCMECQSDNFQDDPSHQKQRHVEVCGRTCHT